MDSTKITSLAEAGVPLPECVGGHPQGLQLLPLPDTNRERAAVRTCAECHKAKSVTEFYRKRDREQYRFWSRCKQCTLKAKARKYKATRKLSPKRRAQREVVWHEIIESPSDEKGNSVNLQDLLRDFMLEAILDAS